MTRRATPPAVPRPAGGDIESVVQAELEIEAALDHAREDARRLIAAATAATESQLAALKQELDLARERFAAEIGAERELRVGEVLAAGTAEAARYDALGGERLSELAGLVLVRLVEGSRA